MPTASPGPSSPHESLRIGITEAMKQCMSHAFHGSGAGRGIVVCGGGYKYFTNAYILARLLRHHGCELPMELWAAEASEVTPQMRTIAESVGFEVRLLPRTSVQKMKSQTLRKGMRWQWMLKPYAIIHSKFNEVLFLDADSFPTRDPAPLFEAQPYREHGAVFWPDVRAMGPDHVIWDIMNVPFRWEREFETGQMLIDKRRCWETLHFALWMNQQASDFYNLIWGDKDTFRFAWHKFGRPFAMIQHPPQYMEFPGTAEVAGLWQHDFEGNWLFQHRNMAKWDLLGSNPRIPGYLFEMESRHYLSELRTKWSGRVRARKSKPAGITKSQQSRTNRLKAELTKGVWLFEDRRPKYEACCAPPIEWSESRTRFPWVTTDPVGQNTPSRYMEISFDPEAIGTGAQRNLYWWELSPRRKEGEWTLDLIGETGTSISMRLQPNGEWQGAWRKEHGSNELLARLVRPADAYPERQSGTRHAKCSETFPPIHIANHAFGIGDAIVGLYAVTGLVKSGLTVVYHTRHPQWLSRVEVPGLTITSEPPPDGTCDLNADYNEQTRYGVSRASWYAMMATNADPRLAPALRSGQVATSISPSRPRVNRSLTTAVLDLTNYVILAPFAAWGMRDWTEAHWRRLAHLLNERGYEVVAVGARKDEDRLKQTFDKSNAYWVVDQTEDWLMAAMLKAQCVIGLDSGMIHLAGLLGVPGICIHAHLPPKFLFNQAPSILSVTPATECAFCRWQPDRGHNEGCSSSCSALVSVHPEQVMAALSSEKLIRAQTKVRRQIDFDTKRSTQSPGEHRLRTNERRPDVIAYSYAPDCGLGEAAAMNIKMMRAAGLTVDHRIWQEVLPPERNLSNPEQIYYHHWHPQPHEVSRDWRAAGFNQQNGAYHIAYWAYEIEKGLPAEFLTAAPSMNEIWTPSTFCRGLFDETGKPVHVVPHAVPSLEALTELPAASGNAPFTVLSLFDAWSRFARKNPQAVIRVFQKAFPKRLDVRLVIKGHHLNPDQMQALQAGCGWDSRITIINRFLSFEELQSLFAKADVYLGLQRGEGFGLNIARSLGCGLPVITTGWSGHLDFAKAENAFLVPYKMSKVAVESDEFYREGFWAEPDERAAAVMLARVAGMVAKRDAKLDAMREHGRSLIQTQFGEEALGRRIIERIAAVRARIAQLHPAQS